MSPFSLHFTPLRTVTCGRAHVILQLLISRSWVTALLQYLGKSCEKMRNVARQLYIRHHPRLVTVCYSAELTSLARQQTFCASCLIGLQSLRGFLFRILAPLKSKSEIWLRILGLSRPCSRPDILFYSGADYDPSTFSRVPGSQHGRE